MNTLLRGLVLAGLCVAFVLPAAAQIVITAADVTAQLAVGNTSIRWTDTSRTPLNIGAPGASSWNFSTLGYHDSTQLTSVTPASTPYAADFPTATHAFMAPMEVDYSGILLQAIGYQYLRLETHLLNPGNKGAADLGGGAYAYLQTTNNPIDTTYFLPSTFGTTWTSSYTSTEVITLGTLEVSRTVKAHNLRYYIDAYGPMTMPGGTVHDALRIKRIDSTDTGKSLRFVFLAKDGATVEFGIDPAAPDTGMQVPGDVTWTTPASPPVSVEPGGDALPTTFALEQNWPNPFNPVTQINYTVGDWERGRGGEGGRNVLVQLTVYDLLGREVAVLVNEQQTPGSYAVRFDGAGLASGVYLYRISAGRFTETKRMMLLR